MTLAVDTTKTTEMDDLSTTATVDDHLSTTASPDLDQTVDQSSSTKVTGLLSDPSLWEPPDSGKTKREETPAVLYSRTDDDAATSSLCSGLGGKKGAIYEVTMTFQELMAWGGNGPIPGLSDTGQTSKEDYLVADGTQSNGSGSLSFRWASTETSSRPITFKIANNGLLNLKRLAAGSLDIAASFGAGPDNGWTLRDGTALDILVAMQIGVDKNQEDSRDYGSLSGIVPNKIASRFNRVLKATVAASQAERVGESKSKTAISDTDHVAKTYRNRDPNIKDGDGRRMSWVDETKFKLNREIGRMFVDSPGRPPVTYITGTPDFTAAIDKMFANNGYFGNPKQSAEKIFMDEVRKLLQQNLDLDWLDNIDPGFKRKFTANWNKKMDEVFNGVNLTRLGKEYRSLPKKKTYVTGRTTSKAPSATVHRNESGKTDGAGQFGMPDFSEWGLKEEKETVAPPETITPPEVIDTSTSDETTDVVDDVVDDSVKVEEDSSDVDTTTSDTTTTTTTDDEIITSERADDTTDGFRILSTGGGEQESGKKKKKKKKRGGLKNLFKKKHKGLDRKVYQKF